jgi:UDP-N-acetylmuramoyl-L-alanyl-D-glutamate--2,6-diaminopimelate ligase
MLLSELINGDNAVSEVDIVGLSSDSREIRPGYLFAALSGTQADGANFIGDAIRHGAVAVLVQPEVATRYTHDVTGDAVQLVADINPRRRLALMAARFYPRQPETVVAVTGTNGKTSVVSFARQIWQRLGFRAASLGTIGITGTGTDRRLEHTTPEPVELHILIDGMAGDGVDHLALEASSHGLDQYRLDGVRVTAAGFTNVTRDHLDYHRDAEDYLYAKIRLFGEVMAPGGIAVLNADDPAFADFEDICWVRGHRIIRVGRGDADLRLVEQVPGRDGQALTVAWQGTEYHIDLPLIGGFQAANALVAAALAIATGSEPGDVFGACEHLEGSPGRMELVDRHPTGAPIFVDYAHTPDALESVLNALRPHTQGRLSVVFGCGGDRDPGKRPRMGEIAARLADTVVITDDNPRGEDPAKIRAEIIAAAPDAAEIDERGAAIRFAIAALQQGDVLVIAGKGHETGQVVQGVSRPFDDAGQVRDALAEPKEGLNDD